LRGKVLLLKQEKFLSNINGSILGKRTGEESFSFKFDDKG
jgi:hypothetical protein